MSQRNKAAADKAGRVAERQPAERLCVAILCLNEQGKRNRQQAVEAG